MKRRIVALILIGILIPNFSGCGIRHDKENAERAVTDFHRSLDKADFDAMYDATDPDFQTASTRQDFVAYVSAVHRKLGNIQSTTEQGWQVNTTTKGTMVVLSYDTKFAGGDAKEAFTYKMNGDQALLRGYNIDSTVLVVK